MRHRGAPPGIVGESTAGAGIMRASGPMRRFERCGDVGTRAEAGIDEPLRPQLLERFGVNGAAMRLNEQWLIPLEPQPDQVLIDAVDELGPAARWVEILDAQQELAAALPRSRVPEERAVSVSQMQPSSGRRREAGDHSSPGRGGGSRICG